MSINIATIINDRRIGTLIPTMADGTRSKKLLLIAGSVLLTVALTLAGAAFCQYAFSHEDTDDAYITGHTSNISSRISGNVVQVFADDNQVVKAGDLLMRLDPSPYQVQVDQAQAALELAQRQALAAKTTVDQTATTATAQHTEANGDIAASTANISIAKSQVTESESAVKAAQAQLESSRAKETEAATDVKRYAYLVKEGAISQQQFDQANTTYQVSVAQVQSDQSQLVQSQAKVSQARATVSQALANLRKSQGSSIQAQATNVQTEVNRDQYQVALASVDKANADLKQALLNLSYTEIKAPVDGHIGRKSVEVGQHVDPGQALMADVEDRPWIIANFKETQVGHMKAGQEVDIKIDSLPNHTFIGHIDSVSPASGNDFALLPADNATGNFTKIVQRIPVKIDFDSQSVKGYEAQIAQGMSAEVAVQIR